MYNPRCPACTYQNPKPAGQRCDICQSELEKIAQKTGLGLSASFMVVGNPTPFQIAFAADATLADLKLKIEKSSGVPMEKQSLRNAETDAEVDGHGMVQFAKLVPEIASSDGMLFIVEEAKRPDPKRRKGAGGTGAETSAKEEKTTRKKSADDNAPEEEDNWDGDVEDDGWGAEGADAATEDWGEADADAWNEEDENSEGAKAKAKAALRAEKAPLLMRSKSGGTQVYGEAFVEFEYDQLLDELMELTGLPYQAAFAVLVHFRWNKARLLERWFSETKRICTDAGVPFPLPEEKEEQQSRKGECPLCFCDSEDMLSLSCGHKYCSDCWGSWCTAEFDKGPACTRSRCPSHKCKHVIPDKVFLRFLTAKKAEEYVRFLRGSVVDCLPDLKWCPSPGCTKVIKSVSASAHKAIRCICGHVWCFNCSNEDHRPISCEEREKWYNKLEGESENVNWILANTKICPKCKVHIEKNQGCNHMTCRKCGHEFCWLCKGDWRGHSNCGGVLQRSEETQRAKDAKTELSRYIHFISGFDAHDKSMRFAKKMVVESQKRTQEIQKLMSGNVPFKDLEYYQQALKVIVECRRALMNVSVYGYYSKIPSGSAEEKMFEMSAQQLIDLTDKIQEILEQPTREVAEIKTRTRIISLMKTVVKYRENLLEHAIDNASLGVTSSSNKSSSSGLRKKKKRRK